MIITFSGPANSGKTTVWEALKATYPGFVFVGEIVRELWAEKWVYEKYETLESLFIDGGPKVCLLWEYDIIQKLSNYVNSYKGTCKTVFFDRGPLDVLVYTILHAAHDSDLFEVCVELCLDMARSIDVSFMFEPVPVFNDDGFRVAHKRDLEIGLFKQLNTTHRVPFMPVKERVNFIEGKLGLIRA